MPPNFVLDYDMEEMLSEIRSPRCDECPRRRDADDATKKEDVLRIDNSPQDHIDADSMQATTLSPFASTDVRLQGALRRTNL